jgi:branched-chain amino acid transport system permease protein
MRRTEEGLGTLAFGATVQVLALQWVDLTGGPNGLSVDRPSFFEMKLAGRHFYYVVIACTALVVWLSYLLVKGRLDRAMLIIKEDEDVAKSLGINVILIKVAIFSASGALAGLAGALYAAQNGYVTPSLFDIQLSLAAVIAVVLGGAGTPFGPIVGAALLTILPEFLHGFEEYSAIVYGTILLMVLRFMPRGILGYRTV